MIGQHKRNFELVPYQIDWIDHFNQEADLLRSILGEKVLQIEHIGSTSIPHMAAKAIIDIMVAVPSLIQSSELFLGLESIGYLYSPLDTIPERLFFSKESSPEFRTHHLNLTKPESRFWKNQLLFRDYLRENNQIASEYIQIKKRFAEYFARTNHLDYEWKSDFVAKILDMAKDENEKIN